MEKVAVLDSGGQYCHLIARKVRDLGVYAEILPLAAPPKSLAPYRGVIISGGPSSVFGAGSPRPDKDLFRIRRPLLGICYGHQLMAHCMEGVVEPGETHEFGQADLRVRREAPLFTGLVHRQRIWMSHGDQVAKLPVGFETLADTRQCTVAAMGNLKRKYFGLQFHPEVIHTIHGAEILSNFLTDVCGCRMDWRPENRVAQLQRQIYHKTKGRRVLFFLSGGVDSAVAYALTVGALRPDLVHGVYVDTGLMREGETLQIRETLRKLGLGSVEVLSARGRFLSGLRKITDPEKKREVIGQLFVELQDDVLKRKEFAGQDWMLGQGTIYPDTIESGGSQNAAVIKTHHNRVKRIQELIAQDRVLEPLTEFYKDEVRVLGRVLGLPPTLIQRHPFPGPGLAIRCLCAPRIARPQADTEINDLARERGYRAFLLPLRSVGVQGDSRSYANLTVLHNGDLDYRALLPLATSITNQFRKTNRVVFLLAPKRLRPSEWKIRQAFVTMKRIALLQEADSIVTKFLHSQGLYKHVWQCPVVLLPFTRKGGETIALRPVTSVDGMTAEVAPLPVTRMLKLAKQIKALPDVDAVFLDLSHKPPSTIEWE